VNRLSDDDEAKDMRQKADTRDRLKQNENNSANSAVNEFRQWLRFQFRLKLIKSDRQTAQTV